MPRNNGHSKSGQSKSPNHERRRRLRDDESKAEGQIWKVRDLKLPPAPKHKHHFQAYDLEKNDREGVRCQMVECTVPGCGLRFHTDKFFNEEKPETEQ